MKPHIPGIGIHFLAQHIECIAFAFPHLLHFLVEEAVDKYSNLV